MPAAYAFVIHTHNPTNNSAEEVFAEVVLGLGESIVSGLVPGSALSFKAPKSSLNKPQVLQTSRCWWQTSLASLVCHTGDSMSHM